VEKIMALKAKQTPSVEVAFSLPPLVVSFAEKPFGFSVNLDESLGLFVVTQTPGQAASKGVKVGMVVTRISGVDTAKLSFSKLCEALGQATLPVSVIFESLSTDMTAEQSIPAASKLEAPDSAAGAAAPPAKLARSEVKVDLAQPLGISFDKECRAKNIQADSQAAKAGVAEGWKALAIDDTAVQTTKELVEHIKFSKSIAASHAFIVFSHPPTTATAPKAAAGSASGSTVAT
jgi:hypothetical protein